MPTVSVRYIVDDVDRAIAFYRDELGFHEDMRPAPPFAMLSRGDLRLLLSAPGGGGSVQGELTAGPDGHTERLGEGDALHFAADVAHSYASDGGCLALCSFSYPAVRRS